MKSYSISLLVTAVGLTLIGSAHANTADAKVYDKRVDHVELIDDVIVAQANTSANQPEVKRRVEVFTHGGPGSAIGPLAMDGPFKYSFGDEMGVIVSNAISEAFSSNTSQSLAKPPIKNAPYSAEVISEKTQSLADGNQITKRSATLTYRDSAGRTREETRDDSGNVRVVRVYDAVDGTRYVLNPASKTATKISTNKLRLDLQKKLDEARARLSDLRGRSDKSSGTARTQAQPSISGDTENEPVNVRVISINGETEVNVNGKVTKFAAEKEHMAQLEAMKTMPMLNAFQDRGYAAKSTTRELGSRDFDGVRAEGKMTSYTIPAGEIGNRNPITVSTETWFSPDLQITVYSKQSDPRYGDTVYRLANIKRNEPAMSLFGVPTDYTVKEAPMKMITSTSTSQGSTSK
jgi:hypothetical protein